jgi:hypothetical protein
VTFEAPTLAESGKMRIAILGDRTTGNPEGLPILDAAVREIVDAEPDFVMTVGDMINGYTRHEGEWLRQFEQEWRRHVDPLDVPLYPTAGNHDTWPGTRSENDHSNEELYKSHFGPLHWSFDVERTHFVILYSDETLSWRQRLSDDQLQWLREDLREMDADHLFVFLHRPLWLNEQSRWDEVHTMLVETGIARAVIAGHFHSYERGEDRDGIAHFILGCTGGSMDQDPLVGGLQHWCLLTIEGERWDLETKIIGGQWVPNDHVRSEARETARAVRGVGFDETGLRGVIPMPFGAPVVKHETSLLVTNPLDTQVSVTVAQETGRGDGWSMRPDEIQLTLGPRASQEIDVNLRYEPIDMSASVEPQINFTYTFTDSRGRRCPVTVQRRLPWIPQIEMLTQSRARVEVDGRRAPPEGWRGGFVAGMPTWNTASWENREGPAQVMITWLGDDHINLFLRFHDDRIEDYPDNEASTPLSDAVVLRSVNASGEARAVAIFGQRQGQRRALRFDDAAPESEWEPLEGVEIATRIHNAFPDVRLWEIRMPVDLWLGDGWRSGDQRLVNVEVHDNDGRYFTDVRSVAPPWNPNTWARMWFRGG